MEINTFRAVAGKTQMNRVRNEQNSYYFCVRMVNLDKISSFGVIAYAHLILKEKVGFVHESHFVSVTFNNVAFSYSFFIILLTISITIAYFACEKSKSHEIYNGFNIESLGFDTNYIKIYFDCEAE